MFAAAPGRIPVHLPTHAGRDCATRSPSLSGARVILPPDRGKRFPPPKLIGAVVLFVLSFGAVVWQCSRVGVLWDFSYIMNTAFRISLGDMPYRDFPIPHAPLTFLIQAGIIHLFGNHFYNAEIYAGLMNGVTAVLTYLLMASIVSRSMAFLCAIPLIFLGGYSILPQPFYESDCCFFLILAIFCAHKSEARSFPTLLSLLSGALLVVPMFVKQNLGLLFFVACHFVLIFLVAIKGFPRDALLGYLKIALGSACALLIAWVVIHSTGGVSNYWYWTYSYAKARRLPPLLDELQPYVGLTVWPWVFFISAGSYLLRDSGERFWQWIGASLCCVPFAWATFMTIYSHNGPHVVSGTLLELWPVMLVLTTFWCLRDLAKSQQTKSFLAMLPLVIFGLASASFLSQGLWGSTYGIWPLFSVLLSLAAGRLTSRLSPRWATIFVGCIVLFLTAAGFSYILRNSRLQFADVDEGTIDRFRSGPLRGFSARGPFVADLEELLEFAKANIPSSEGVILLPGEDPFFFATGRRPAFPVLVFDDTLNPYDPDDLASLIKTRNIPWIICKTQLQVNEPPMDDLPTVIRLLKPEYEIEVRLRAYDVYRRHAGARPAE